MAVNKSGEWWTGDEPDDISEYLRAYSSDGYPVQRVVHARCETCDGQTFAVRVDDEEGCAERTCASCAATTTLMLDSADFVEDADLEDAACPCGGEVFNVAVGFALRVDDEVRWVYIGLRCVADGILGCNAEWKIDYAPTAHLFTQV